MIGCLCVPDRITMKFTYRQQEILEILKKNPNISISEIRKLLKESISQPTLNRDLAKLVLSAAIEKFGKARAIRYQISARTTLLESLNLDTYFADEVDFRGGKKYFDNEIFSVIEKLHLFTVEEENYLETLQEKFRKNIKISRKSDRHPRTNRHRRPRLSTILPIPSRIIRRRRRLLPRSTNRKTQQRTSKQTREPSL